MASGTREISRRLGAVAKLVVRKHSSYPRRTNQRSPHLQASMIILSDCEKEESKMCVVLIGIL